MMSTFNGDKYLDVQMRSLLKQTNVKLDITIRDDGSSDETVKILNKYKETYPKQISIVPGKNVGVVKSFFELIQSSVLDHEYYAFCDQDDYWESNKLYRAIEALQNINSDEPLLYCSSTKMVDEQLSYIKTWPNEPQRPLTVFNALIENVCVGCTMVINREAMKLIKENFPLNLDEIIMHDWWIYLCISTFGYVIFDGEPTILYRQHQSNVLGGATGGVISKWRKRLVRFVKGDNYYILSRQAKEYLTTYQSLINVDQSNLIKEFLEKCEGGIFARISYIFGAPLYRQSKVDDFTFKLIFIMGKA